MDYDNNIDIEKSDGLKTYNGVDTEEELRLQCADFATRHPFYGDPEFLAIQLYKWIKEGVINTPKTS